MKIKYEPHPVSPERKAELREQGFKIIDARFDPEGSPAGEEGQGDGDDLAELRAEYTEVIGKKPFNGWDADQLREKIEVAENAPND